MKFVYSPVADLGEPLNKRLGRYPRIPDITWDALRCCGSWLSVGLLQLQFQLCVSGEIPQGDRVALVANHQSHLDTITLLAALPAKRRRDVVVLAAEDYFFHRIGRALAASLLCQAVAFDRCSVMELRRWRDRLQTTKSGWILFYPSGSRKSYYLQKGLLKLLLQSGWTIVPVRLEGTGQAWAIDSRFWHPFERLSVKFHEPYSGSDLDELINRLQRTYPTNFGNQI